MSPKSIPIVVLIGVIVAGGGVYAQTASEKLTALPAVQNVNLGDNVTLECHTQGSQLTATNFVWYHGVQKDIIFFGDVAYNHDGEHYKLREFSNLVSKITIVGIRFEDHGLWQCEASFGESNPIESVETTLSIKSPPQWQNLTQRRTFNLNRGRSVELNCSAMGDPTPTVVWTGDTSAGGIVLPDGRVTEYYIGSVLTLGNVTAGHAGRYSCRASNGLSPAKAAEFVVKVPFQPKVTVHTSVVRAPSDRTFTIGCKVQAHPQVTRDSEVAWYRESIRIVNGQNGFEFSVSHEDDPASIESIITLTTPKVDSSVIGDYRCEATNTQGRGVATIRLEARPFIQHDAGATDNGAAEVSSFTCLLVTVLALVGSRL